MEKNGSPRAIFETDEDRRAVCVTIPIQPDYLHSLDSQNNDQTTDQDTNQAVQDAPSKENQISEKEKQLLNLFEGNSRITQAEAASILDWKPSLVKYYVDNLKKKGRLERVGTSQKGYWKVNR